MKILFLSFTLYAPWIHSLKEKRSTVKRLIGRLDNHFNASIVESDTQDILQTITIGIALIVFNSKQSDQLEESIMSFIESNTEASIMKMDREIF